MRRNFKFQILNFKKQITPQTTYSGGRGGFTLLELLVVIGIVAILVSFGAVSYNVAQARSRDARRRADIKTIGQAMEQAYASSSNYTYTVCSTEVAIASANCDIATYFSGSNVPTDPGTTFYRFTASTTTAYTVCATLEAGGNFCLNNLQ